jgi:hypothetical protein
MWNDGFTVTQQHNQELGEVVFCELSGVETGTLCRYSAVLMGWDEMWEGRGVKRVHTAGSPRIPKGW